jgi:polysaccharide biosynthesis transport protein
MERTTPVAVNRARAPTLADRLAAVRRRRVPAIVAGIVVLLSALAAALLWPATYRSTGTILIEQQEVPVDVVRSMISSYADQRIQVISQRVMTTDNLMRIIDRYQLYPEDRRTLPREVLIAQMRKDIGFRMIAADVVDPRVGRPTKATIAFAVSFDSRSPVLAAKVANELTTLYLNENLESRKRLSDNTASFLEEEANRLSKQIADLETALAAFKEKHSGSLPELMQMNLSMMNRTEDEMRETDTVVRSLDQQLVYLDAQLAQLQPAAQIYTSTGERVMSPADRLKILKSEYARANAIYAPDHPDIVRMKREIAGFEREAGAVDTGNDLARQLRDAQGQLAQAREKYAADHPDVQQLQRVVDGIGKAMAQAPATSEAVRNDEPDNPAYIQISAQREATLSEKTSLLIKRAALQLRLADFELRLSRAPQIEREYSGMVRELDNAQLKYREVRQKYEEAMVSKNMETGRRGERFTLIEPPLEAQKPVSPNRKAIAVLGMVLSIAAAIGLIALLEAADASIRGKRDVENLLAVAPLAILPWMDTPQAIARRGRWRRYSLIGAATSVVCSIALVHFFVRPLDVLWQVTLRRLLG